MGSVKHHGYLVLDPWSVNVSKGIVPNISGLVSEYLLEAACFCCQVFTICIKILNLGSRDLIPGVAVSRFTGDHPVQSRGPRVQEATSLYVSRW